MTRAKFRWNTIIAFACAAFVALAFNVTVTASDAHAVTAAQATIAGGLTQSHHAPADIHKTGAKRYSISPAKKRRLAAPGGGGTSAGGVGCHGLGNCGKLLKEKGAKCKHWRCNKDVDGQPSCWCDL